MPDYGETFDPVGTECLGYPQPGALRLRTALLTRFPSTSSLGIYACRNVGGTERLSAHAEGRALDLACDTHDGDILFALLHAKHRALGIQRLIWNRLEWRAGGEITDYKGENPHIDHIHLELCWASARDNPLTEEHILQALAHE